MFVSGFGRTLGRSTLALAGLLIAPLASFAQTGNLAVAGRFDDAGDVAAFEFSDGNATFDFDQDHDADLCPDSRAAVASVAPGAGTTSVFFRYCVGAVQPGDSYRVSAAFLFETADAAGHFQVAVSFWKLGGCSDSGLGSVGTPFATTAVGGWQRVESAPAVVPVDASSALVDVILTRDNGVDPTLYGIVDEVRLVKSDWIFAEDFEIGDPCRWSLEVP